MRVLPGPTPFLLTADEAREIRSGGESEWFVSSKIDGLRMLVVVMDSTLYLFNRAFEPYDEVALAHPWLSGITIMDAELLPETAMVVVHDCIVAENCFVGDADYGLRIRVAQKVCGKLGDFSDYSIVRKDILSAIPQHVTSVMSSALKSDGLIFTRNRAPFMDRGRNVLKWKSGSDCTVDFLVKRGDDGRHALFLQENDVLIFADYLGSSPPSGVAEMICECVLSEEGWKIVRERRDRNRPNSVSVAMQALAFQKLSEFIQKTVTQ